MQKVKRFKKPKRAPVLICCLMLFAGQSGLSQAQTSQELESGSSSTADIAERVARIEELRKDLRTEQRLLRESRRHEIQARLEGLTEDEREALRERRQMRLEARQRQQRSAGSQARSCQCENSADTPN